jgi:integrase
MLLVLCNRAEEYGLQDQVNATPAPKRVPWNKGKLTGAKPPLRPKHVWSIRTKLQIEGRARDLAMFNLAIDSKLRGCDVVAIRVEDVAAGGYTADRATVRQKKTGRPVRFELSEQTRQAVDDYLKIAGKRPGEFLFTGRRGPDRTVCPARVRVDRKRRAGPKAVRDAFTATDKSYPDLPADWQSQGRPASARTHDILPANNRLKHASLTDFILASARR